MTECRNHTLNLGRNLVNIVLILVEAIIGERELSVRGEGGAVTVGQIVDNNLNELVLGLGIGKVATKVGNLGNRIKPSEGRDFSNRSSLGCQTRIGYISGRLRDLVSIEG